MILKNSRWYSKCSVLPFLDSEVRYRMDAAISFLITNGISMGLYWVAIILYR